MIAPSQPAILDATLNVVTGEIRIVLGTIPTSAILLGDGQFYELACTPIEDGCELLGHITSSKVLPQTGRVLVCLEDRWLELNVSLRHVPEAVHTPGVVLSICIPTFNRSARVVETVRNILKSDLQTIEVVVCDNASTDETVKQLRAIEDTRLKIYVNDRNWGPIRNFNLALALGRGEYVLLHSDEDAVKLEALGEFVEFLSTNSNIGAGLTSVTGSRVSRVTRILSAGAEALRGTALGFSYLGGFFYKRNLYNAAQFFNAYDDPAFLYPFEAIAWLLAGIADFCFYAPVVVERGRNDTSFFPRIDGRHFNHPVNLVAQYQMRCRYFEMAARDLIDAADYNVAAANFRAMMLRQNFILCYTMPTDEMLELLQVLVHNAPETLDSVIVRSFAFQLMGDISNAIGEDATLWLKKAIETDPQNSTAAFQLADTFSLKGETEAEARLYSQIIESTPKRWAFLAQLIVPLQERKRSWELEQVKALLLRDDMMTPEYILKQFLVQ